MDIPDQFLGKIAQQLARAGLIEIVQGARGGFRLLVSPAEVTLLDVVEAVIGEIFLNDCLMRTADGVSPIAASQVAVSLVAFILSYGLLGGVGYYLIGKYARLGPDAVAGPAPVRGKSLSAAAV